MMKSNTEIVVLDMAGTTVHDEGLVMAAFKQSILGEGIDETNPQFESMIHYVQQTMGTSKIDVFSALFSGDMGVATRANNRFEEAFQELVNQGLATPIDGAEETIRTLRAAGIRVALTTGFSPATRDGLVAALGWNDLVDLALSPADVGRGRPFPDLILGAMLRLGGTSVHRVVTVGDTVADVQSGLASGAGLVVGVSTGTHSQEELLTAGADEVLASIAELPNLLGVDRAPIHEKRKQP